MNIFDYGSSTARRTFTNTYSAASALTSRYIRNRLLTATVLEAGVTTTIVTNVYDGYNTAIVNVNNLRQFDTSNNTAFTARGNLTSSTTLSGVSSNYQFDITGTVLQSAGPSGVNAITSTNSSTNFTAPSSITVGSLTSTFNSRRTYCRRRLRGRMAIRRPPFMTRMRAEIVDFEDWRGDVFRVWNEPDAGLHESDRECGGPGVECDAGWVWACDQAGGGYRHLFERVGCDHAEHDRVDGRYAVRTVRLLAAGEIEPDVAAVCAGRERLLDGLHIRRDWADDVGEGARWGEYDELFVHGRGCQSD